MNFRSLSIYLLFLVIKRYKCHEIRSTYLSSRGVAVMKIMDFDRPEIERKFQSIYTDIE